MANNTGKSGKEVDEIYKLEDELITLNARIITLQRMRDDVKEQAEMDIETEYRIAKEHNNNNRIAELSNEKLRKFASKLRLDTLEVEISGDGTEEEFILYNELVDLIDAAELEKFRLIRDVGLEKRQFVREYGRAGMQALTDNL